jgi:glucose/arabinose dehydrogenase
MRGLASMIAFGLAGCGDGGGGGDETENATAADSTGGDPDGGPGPGTQSTGPSTQSGADSTSGSAGPGSGSSDSGDGSESGSSDDGNVAPPCPYEPVEGEPAFHFEEIGHGFLAPVQIVGEPTAPDRLFVVQQFGEIKILEPGQEMAPADNFLEVDTLAGGERGLLSMAFHPDYPDDQRFYVYYTVPGDGRSRIEEYRFDADDPNHADVSSARIILEVFQGTASHHGGMMHFDEDGWLIIGFGDGADSTSPNDMGVIHSKFIRIGVEEDGTLDNPLACQGCETYGPFDYTIPPDNPHLGDDTYAPEIWTAGFRNPWRWYTDPETGFTYVGDVGNETYEEVSVIEPGQHYGWAGLEGNHCGNDPGCDATADPGQANADGFIAPLVDYAHVGDSPCAVVGGPVYRSCEVPAWQGIYFYGDYCGGWVRALRWDGAVVDDLGTVWPTNIRPFGSGTNAWGEVFFVGGVFSGELYKLQPARP